MVDLEESVPQVLAAYKKAVAGKDAAALMQLYDPKPASRRIQQP